MTVRTGSQAGQAARSYVGKAQYHLMCKAFVRAVLQVEPSRSATAIECFREAEHKHLVHDAELIPAFVPVFMDTSNWAEHALFSVGRDRAGFRLAVSTDAGPGGTIGLVRLGALARAWGPILGWTEDFDGRRVYADKPSISHRVLLDAARHEGTVRGDPPLHPRPVGYIERALVAEGLLNRRFVNGRFGPRKRRAFARWQVKVGQPSTGIPDMFSTERLGRRHAFDVRP